MPLDCSRILGAVLLVGVGIGRFAKPSRRADA
jgi:hypothetical protein